MGVAHEVASAGAQASDPSRWGLVVCLVVIGRERSGEDQNGGRADWMVGMDATRYALAGGRSNF